MPHHSWPGLIPTPPRETIKTVAYQGNPAYLGAWLGRLAHACEARGWAFEINPSDLRRADLLVAFRDGPWDGWMCRQWKSGVKLVNAIAAGRPILRQRSAASDELDAPGALVESVAELEQAFEQFAARDVREEVYDQCRRWAPAYRIEAIADRYREWLATVITHVTHP